MDFLCKEGNIEVSSPSNIAFVKYWGKRNFQLPLNSSVSMTLEKSRSNVKIDFSLKKQASSTNRVLRNFLFEGKENEKFALRIESYFQHLKKDYPFLERYEINVFSSNTFPHSSGIASSASFFSALAGCISFLLIEGLHEHMKTEDTFEKQDSISTISSLARQGSGSASRSFFSHYGQWSTSFDEGNYAEGLSNIHPDFLSMKNSIAIVSSREKRVSSKAGHHLFENHLFREQRIGQGEKNFEMMKTILQTGDFKSFFPLLEEEALTLHALMMTSRPGYMLMLPESLQLMNDVRSLREEEGLEVGFTLDAGPNVHILYPEREETRVMSFLNDKYPHLNQEKLVIHDSCAKGAILVNKELRY